MDYKHLLKYFPFAKAAYGAGGKNAVPFGVGEFKVVSVPGFIPTEGSGINPALLFNERTGEYVIAYAGTVDVADGVADAGLAFQKASALVSTWHGQFTDAVAFAAAVVEHMLDKEPGLSLQDIQRKLSVSGHSLGGSEAEIVAKLLGLKGANIDGPGVSALLRTQDFKDLQDLPVFSRLGLPSNIDMRGVGFKAFGFTVVSQPGIHIAGSEFEEVPGTSLIFNAATSSPWWIGVPLAGVNALGHPSDAILQRVELAVGISQGQQAEFDTFGFSGEAEALWKSSKSATSKALWYGWVDQERVNNVNRDLSPSGYLIDGEPVVSHDGRYMVTVTRDQLDLRIVKETYFARDDETGGELGKIEKKFLIEGEEGSRSVGVFTAGGVLQFFRQSTTNLEEKIIVNVRGGSDPFIEVVAVNAIGIVNKKFKLTEDQAYQITEGQVSVGSVINSFNFGINDLSKAWIGGEKLQLDAVTIGGKVLKPVVPASGGDEGGENDLAYESEPDASGWYEGIDSGGRYLVDPDGGRVSVGADQTIVYHEVKGHPVVVHKDDIVYWSDGGASASFIARDGSVNRYFFGPDGRISRRQVSQTDGNGIASVSEYDGVGNFISSTKSYLDRDGNMTVSVEHPGGRSVTTRTNRFGGLIDKIESETTGSVEVQKTYRPGGSGDDVVLFSTGTITRREGKVSEAVINYADGAWERKEYDDKEHLISTTGAASPIQSFGTAVEDVNALVQAIRGGKPLPVLNGGLQLLNHQVNPVLSGSGTQIVNNQPLFTTTAVAGAINSVYGLYNAFANNGSALQKLAATGNALVAINAATNAVAAQVGGELAQQVAAGTALNAAAGSVSKALPYLNIAVSLQQGDYTGAAVATAAAIYNIPYIGWIYAAYSLISSMDDEPPEAWGLAKFKFGDGTLVTVDTTGEGIGMGKVGLLTSGNGESPTLPDGTPNTAYFGGLLGYLNDIANQANHANPDTPLGIVAQRLPSLVWNEARKSEPGFSVTDIDPMTGEARYPSLRYDDSFHPINADPTDPDQRLSLFDRLVKSAMDRQAIAPMWEVRTARLQQDIGDPDAGLTEEERGARHGFAVGADPQGKPLPGKFRPVVLDLNGDGEVTTVALNQSSVTFDWDDSGYLKSTGWIAATEGMLVLDRNLNGIADSGKELFSNGWVSDEVKGLRSMRWVDANADGVIDAHDPVFEALRVWQDVNQDGEQEGSETFSLTQLGITRIDYANGRFARNGDEFSIRSPDLETSNEGVAINVVEGGIQVDSSDGHSTLHVTQVIDLGGGSGQGTEFVVRDDGILSWEDGVSPGNPAETGYPRPQKPTDNQSITIAFAQLLANDQYQGGNQMLTISSVGDAQHGTVRLNAEDGSVEFTPEHNYVGLAGFSYVVTAPDGQTRSATVAINLQAVVDEAQVSYTLDQRPIYGYGVLGHPETYTMGEDATTYIRIERDAGTPMYAPYQTVMGRSQTLNSSGEVSFYEYGPLEDTGIPLDHFLREYDRVLRMQSGDASPVTQVVIKMYGRDYAIDASPPLLMHDTPIGTETANDGVIRAVSGDGGQGGFRYEIAEQGLYGQVQVDANTGRFTYTGKRYVENDLAGNVVGANIDTDEHGRHEETFADVFKVKVVDLSDPTGKTFVYQDVSVTHFGPRPMPEVASGGGKKPIAVDLNGDGFHFTDVDDSNVFFDVNGDGWRRRMAWNNPDDGFIAFDKNGDGKITDFDELSFVPYKPGSQTDLEGLKAFDSNGDGLFSAADEKWASFGVWQDANANGITDPGEFKSLASLGIEKIAFFSDGKFQVINGQSVHGIGSATRSDGSALALADVTLRYLNETQGKTADGTVVTAPLAPFATGETFTGTAGADLVFGTAGSDQYHLGAGNDVVSDGAGDDAVDAGDGDDIVMTGEGKDYVDAGAGNDSVFTDAGDDVVLAGAGDDFVSLGEGNDIAFGGDGQDMLTGGSGNDLLSGDKGDDQLFGESGRDILFGMEGADQLWGGEGDDQLDGGAGNDLLDGGAGADVMTGGLGNDRYAVDNVNDVVIELEDGGFDIVVVDHLAQYALGEHLEGLQLGQGAVSGIGNALDNQLWGNDEANQLDGGAGADEMAGGAGNDTYLVDDELDRVVEFANKGMDTVLSRVDYTLSANVENLTLVGGARHGIGNALDNLITGNDGGNHLEGAGGNDTLMGGAGNDVLDGGAGADTMTGGAGDDVYMVDDEADVVVERGANPPIPGGGGDGGGDEGGGDDDGGGNDGGQGEGHYSFETEEVIESVLRLLRKWGYASADRFMEAYIQGIQSHGGPIENRKEFVSSLNLPGYPEDWILEEFASQFVRLENQDFTLIYDDDGSEGEGGGDGDGDGDGQEGGAGQEGGNGGNPPPRPGGHDRVVSTVSYRLSDNVEDLVLSGLADINGTGNSLDNAITGNAGKNRLDGGGGADTMTGGAGDDFYVVDNSHDLVVELAGEGEGVDTVLATGLNRYELGQNIENLIMGFGVREGIGNELDNAVTGNELDNLIQGGAGADALDGGGGDDTYVFEIGDGVDRISDSSGADLIRFGDGISVENLALLADEADGDDAQLLLVLVDAQGMPLDDGILLDGNSTSGYAIERVRFSDGVEMSMLELVEAIKSRGAFKNRYVGGDGDDVFYLSDTERGVMNGFFGGGGTNRIQGGWTGDTLLVANHLQNLRDIHILDGGGDPIWDNYIMGTQGDDVLDFSGMVITNFTLDGGAGNDTIIGTAGNDRIHGNEGHDILIGGHGDDTFLLNGDSDDEFDGGSGVNRIQGDWWRDVLHVGSHLENLRNIQVLHGGGDPIWDNYIVGTQGDDVLDFSGMTVINFTLDGGAGDDTIIGTAGDDRINGGNGHDVLLGGDGDDTFLLSRYSEDEFDGGAGVNRIQGDWDGDTLMVTNHLDNLRNIQFIDGGSDAWYQNRILGTEGDDTLDFSGMTITNFTLEGGAGNDTITGTAGRDLIRGGWGNDVLDGGQGDDVFFWSWGDGDDHIADSGGANVLSFDQDISLAQVSVLTMGTSHQIQVSNGVSTSVLTIDRSVAGTTKVQIGGGTYLLEELPAAQSNVQSGAPSSSLLAGDLVSAWDLADSNAAMREAAGWDSLKPETGHLDHLGEHAALITSDARRVAVV